MPSDCPGVLLERQGPVARVMLNHPERHNALSGTVVSGLADAMAELATAADVRAVVIHGGTAGAFCVGADLKERAEMTPATVFATVRRLRAAVDAVAQLPMPVIAAIHGACFGGGLELALACDLRIAATDAVLGLTEVSLGVIPGAGGTQRLARVVGVARAKELIFTAARLPAADALALGLLNRVVPVGTVLTAAAAVAAAIAAMAPVAVRAAKAAINAGAGLADGLEAEWAAYQALIPTQDRSEGLAAFLEKRPPRWQGR